MARSRVRRVRITRSGGRTRVRVTVRTTGAKSQRAARRISKRIAKRTARRILRRETKRAARQKSTTRRIITGPPMIMKWTAPGTNKIRKTSPGPRSRRKRLGSNSSDDK